MILSSIIWYDPLAPDIWLFSIHHFINNTTKLQQARVNTRITYKREILNFLSMHRYYYIFIWTNVPVFLAFWICSQTFLPKLLLRNCRAVITSNLCLVYNACLHRLGPIFLSRQAVFNLPPWFIGAGHPLTTMPPIRIENDGTIEMSD